MMPFSSLFSSGASSSSSRARGGGAGASPPRVHLEGPGAAGPQIIVTPSTPAIPFDTSALLQAGGMMYQQQQQPRMIDEKEALPKQEEMEQDQGRMMQDALYSDLPDTSSAAPAHHGVVVVDGGGDEKHQLASSSSGHAHVHQRAPQQHAQHHHHRAISDFKLADPDADAYDLYHGLEGGGAAHHQRRRQAAEARTHRRAIHLVAAFLTLLLVSVGLTSSCFEAPHTQAAGATLWADDYSGTGTTWHAIVETLHLPHTHHPASNAAWSSASDLVAAEDDDSAAASGSHLTRWLRRRSFASSISTFAHFEHESEAARDVDARAPASAASVAAVATSPAAGPAAAKAPLPLMRFGLATLVDEGESLSPLALRRNAKRAVPATSSAVHVVSAAEVQRQLMREAQDRLHARRQQRMGERMRS